MKVETFTEILGAEFYTGVPDSQLRPLCDYLMNTFGTAPRRHVIAANEGNAAALAAGYHLSTGKTPVVYLQNSGLGNIVNPAASLLHQKVYAIPCLFVVGWRGEPGVHDEPQHIFQGEITLEQLALLEIPAFVLGKDISAPAGPKSLFTSYSITRPTNRWAGCRRRQAGWICQPSPGPAATVQRHRFLCRRSWRRR